MWFTVGVRIFISYLCLLAVVGGLSRLACHTCSGLYRTLSSVLTRGFLCVWVCMVAIPEDLCITYVGHYVSGLILRLLKCYVYDVNGGL